MTMEGPRVMDKTLNYLTLTLGEEPSFFPATVTGSDWEVLENLATPTFVQRTYYDLSGYALKDLTAFIQGVDIQEAYPPFGTEACTIIDMITTEHVDNATILAAFKYIPGTGDLPGFPRSTYDMQQVVYGRTRDFSANSTWGDSLALQGQSTFGIGTATNAEKLYITRIVYLSVLAAGTAFTTNIPPCDYVTAVIVAKEKDIPYLMRQKRSYEHTSGL